MGVALNWQKKSGRHRKWMEMNRLYGSLPPPLHLPKMLFPMVISGTNGIGEGTRSVVCQRGGKLGKIAHHLRLANKLRKKSPDKKLFRIAWSSRSLMILTSWFRHVLHMLYAAHSQPMWANMAPLKGGDP